MTRFFNSNAFGKHRCSSATVSGSNHPSSESRFSPRRIKLCSRINSWTITLLLRNFEGRRMQTWGTHLAVVAYRLAFMWEQVAQAWRSMSQAPMGDAVCLVFQESIWVKQLTNWSKTMQIIPLIAWAASSQMKFKIQEVWITRTIAIILCSACDILNMRHSRKSGG